MPQPAHGKRGRKGQHPAAGTQSKRCGTGPGSSCTQEEWASHTLLPGSVMAKGGDAAPALHSLPCLRGPAHHLLLPLLPLSLLLLPLLLLLLLLLLKLLLLLWRWWRPGCGAQPTLTHRLVHKVAQECRHSQVPTARPELGQAAGLRGAIL